MDKNNLMFIYKLYEFKLMNKLTMPQFAKLCGISTYRLNKIIKGDTISILSNVDKLAKAMNVEPADLIDVEAL